jgi:hypothetical protein
MGTWDIGLYSSDIAIDLKLSIKVICSLPYDDKRIVDEIVESYKDIAFDKDDEDCTVFWLVLADQLHKKGFNCPEVFEKAIRIIDSGQDVKIFRDLGADESSLKKREGKLQKLKDKLIESPPNKVRKILKKPEKLLFDIGDVILFPLDERGLPFNPYYTAKQIAEEPDIFIQTGWGAAVIVDNGLIYDYLTYYKLIVCNKSFEFDDKPRLNTLMNTSTWVIENPGTCSKSHFKKMQIEKIGTIDINKKRAKKIFANHKYALSAAVDNISISNYLNTGVSLKYTNVINSLYDLPIKRLRILR